MSDENSWKVSDFKALSTDYDNAVVHIQPSGLGGIKRVWSVIYMPREDMHTPALIISARNRDGKHFDSVYDEIVDVWGKDSEDKESDTLEVSKAWLQEQMEYFLSEAFSLGQKNGNADINKLQEKLKSVIETGKNSYYE